MKLKEQIANGALVGMSAVLLWHFANIWRYGQHLVGEPNLVIRTMETAVIFLIFVLGISRFVETLRRSGEVGDDNRERF